ncbi:neurofibromin-like isoform X2 [Nematostella vectensis]|uniref:neurofibromin-like isoform X2 n=1 Tax=Nematostella vectensis TaxID=45351 RepID=UPI0020773C7E|nr:neurofibromin-like isoform X2 [Nematostella vectensis]
MPKERKPDEWVVLILRRFQQQLPLEGGSNHESREQISEALVQVSDHRFIMVVTGLTRMVKEPTFLCAMLPERVQLGAESNLIILKTLSKCFEKNPEQCAALTDDALLKIILPSLCQFVSYSYGIPLEAEQKTECAKILSHISVHHFSALFNRIAIRLHVLASSEDNSDTGDLELIQHLNVNVSSLQILLREGVQVFKTLKKPGQLAFVAGLEKAIWNWVENSPEEFAQLQRSPSQELSDYAMRLFDHVNHFADSAKRKGSVWPLQIMLLILCPTLLQEIATREAIIDVTKVNKKEFLDGVKKALTGTKNLTESAAVVSVKLCKAANYMRPEDNSVLCFLVLNILNELKALLFNVNKPFALASGSVVSLEELMLDCFVSSFRINYRNSQHFDPCLLPSSPVIFNLVCVKGIYMIVTETPLSWWPKADVLHPKAQQIRSIFLHVLHRIQTADQEGQQSRLSQIYKVKEIHRKHKEEDGQTTRREKDLLMWLVKLFHADPVFAFHSQDTHGWEIQKSASQIIMGLVHLVLSNSLSYDIKAESAQALMCSFQADTIEMWNPVAPIATFWEISSHVLVSVAEVLNNHGSHSTRMLKYLKELIICKNEFLRRHREHASTGSHIPICSLAQTKLEAVFLTYLWSSDIEATLVALSCFGHLCEEIDIVQSSENLNELNSSSNLNVLSELAAEATKFTAGRASLQKKIMALLRQLDRQTPGNVQAWDDTYTRWQRLTYALTNYGKDDTSVGMAASYLTSVRKRASSSLPRRVEDMENSLNEWTYMTGFLCSLGGVCLTTYQNIRRYSRVLPSMVQTSGDSQVKSNSSVTRFLKDLISLLVCSNEKLGVQVRVTVNELIGTQLSPTLYPILFEEIKDVLKTFFTSAGQAIVQDTNTLFVDQVIVIMKYILDNKGQTERFQLGSVENMILTFIRYVRNLPLSTQALQIKTKLCNLVDVVMGRREELLFHQEMKFRNKLVEYMTDWVLHSADQKKGIPMDLAVLSNELDATVMRAIASLLSGLPLQPEGMETDIVDAKSQLFLKYFTLFINLMSGCKAPRGSVVDQRHVASATATNLLHQSTVLAMSNLLNANIDTGLMYAIGLGYHDDPQTRAVFMEVLTKILQQGTEFDNLADTVLMDRFDRIVELVTLTGEKGELPIAMALVSVVPSQQLDELAQVLVTLFDSKNILSKLLKNIFALEVRSAEGVQTLFRGNSLASKVMSFCFKVYGTSYLQTLLEPLVSDLIKNTTSFEVDPERIENDENIEANRNNLIKLAQEFVDKITASADSLPVPLRSLCHCLKRVVQQRFPRNSTEAVNSAIFLRFINPAIISPHMVGITDEPPSDKIRRGLMNVSKILQNLGNHLLFSKEKYMEPFNGFLEANFEKTRKFLESVSTDCSSLPSESASYSFLSDGSVFSLHKLLWDNQEKIGTYLATRREYKAFGRRPFEKMSTLLAHIGPPDQHKMTFDPKWPFHGGSRFEEFMARHAEGSQDDLQSIRSQNIFYQGGRSNAGNPVFYYIARRFRPDVINDELLIYHMLLVLEPFNDRPWELVVDFTHTTLDNRFKTSTIIKCLTVVPKGTLNNLVTVYMYNSSSSLRQYTKYNERHLSPLKGRSCVRVCETLSKLHEYIKESELRLPSSTTSLEEDLKVFTAFRLSTRSNVQLRIGPMSVQITTPERHKVLGYSTILNDVYYASEVKGAIVEDENTFVLKFVNGGPGMLLMSNECDQIVQAVMHVKTAWQLSQPDAATSSSKKIKPKDVPGTLLNMALLNLGSRDPTLRLAAYNLLCAVTKAFNLKIEERLLEGTGLCIPANNTIFIVGISEKLAAREPQLTLEFLEECIEGFMKSDTELKHLCLEYMAPWLPNLDRFWRFPSDDPQKIKMNSVLEKLISITVSERGAMNPSIQANIWGTIGKVTELLDTVLDSFLKASAAGGLGSVKAEVLADTAAALASANVQVVSSKVIGRLHTLISKTFISPTLRLEQHLMWDDIAILTRYLLMLSFNDCLDVASHIPYLFHLVTLLVSTGPPTIRASIHGLLINVIHSLCTCTYIKFSEETLTLLRMRLSELSTPKFYLLFGISKIETPAVKAFRATQRGHRFHIKDSGGASITMPNIETITEVLLEIMETCMKDIPDCTWLKKWMELASNFAYQFNPALQPRTIVVVGCISNEASDDMVQRVLQVLIIALSNYTDLVLIEAAVICLTKLQGILGKESKFHKAFFWIAVAVLQLSELALYPCGLVLLEQSLLTLDSHGVFEEQAHKVLMAVRQEPLLEFHCKQMDHFVGVSFYENFHFALVAHLVKGVYHPQATSSARAIRVLNLMLDITSKHKHRDKFAVTKENLAYLAALIPVSEDVRNRLKPGDSTNDTTNGSIAPSTSDANINNTSGSIMSIESRVSIVITPSESPRADDVSANRQAFVWPSECQHLLLDPGIVNDKQTQALLLTTLVMLLEHTASDVEVRYLYQLLAEASLVFPSVFPVIFCQLDSNLGTVLGHSEDLPTLKAVQTIIHSVTAAKDSEDAIRNSYLASFGFTGFSQFTKFKDQSGQNNRAQLFMKFLEAILEVYGKGMPSNINKALQIRKTSSMTSPKANALSSSSGDIPSIGSSTNLSSSLTSLPAAVGSSDLGIPMPFKRTGSSYRPRKISGTIRLKRNKSTKAVRTTSVQGTKFS